MLSKIDTLTKRRKLKPRSWPYWEKIAPGRFLGFYRNEGGGTWHARLRKGSKQVYEKLGGTIESDFTQILKKAQEWLDLAGEVEDHRYTVTRCVADYVVHLKVENGETSSLGVKQRMEKHLVPILGTVELAKLTTPQLKHWRDSKVRVSDDTEDVRKSKDSANRMLSQAKAAFNLAFRNGLIASDKAWRRVSAFEGVGVARKLFLTDEQVARLLKKTNGAFHQLVKSAVLTGARYGELIQARVRDLDLTNGTLHLTGKTGQRDCYLSDEALAFLKELIRDRLPDAFLLVKDNGMPWGKSHQQRPMSEAVKSARMPRETVFYSLRHYYISKALLAGITAQVVAENCGTSIRMLEKHYAKFMATDRREMMNQVLLG